jgi:CO/xanthine dehydrogenase FAD-binding subunit
VGVAVSLTLKGPTVRNARIVLTGVGGKPFRAREAETLLLDASVPERAAAAATAARSSIDPEADIHASKEYRAHIAGVLTERAIRLAYERALANSPAALDVRRALEMTSRYA